MPLRFFYKPGYEVRTLLNALYRMEAEWLFSCSYRGPYLCSWRDSYMMGGTRFAHKQA